MRIYLGVILIVWGVTAMGGLPAFGQAPATQPAEGAKEKLPDLTSDRPDFTESPTTITPGHLQLESGYTFTYDDEKGHRVSEQTVPEFLLRIGVIKDLEFRTSWTGMSLVEDLFHEKNDAGRRVRREVHDDGATDITTGVKWHIADQEGLRPELALIGELSLPAGTDSKSSGDVDPQIKGIWSYDLTERLGLSGNVNFAVPTEESRRFFQTSASVSLGYSLTDQVGTFIEYFGFYPNARGSDCAHQVDGGFTFQITDNLQFDVRVGAGLNEEAPDFFTGAGVVIRL